MGDDMFRIKLVDIAGDGLVTEFDSNFETLAAVEILVKATLNEHLGIHCVELIHNEDLIYSVWVNGHEIGICVIMSINPAPLKRK